MESENPFGICDVCHVFHGSHPCLRKSSGIKAPPVETAQEEQTIDCPESKSPEPKITSISLSFRINLWLKMKNAWYKFSHWRGNSCFISVFTGAPNIFLDVVSDEQITVQTDKYGFRVLKLQKDKVYTIVPQGAFIPEDITVLVDKDEDLTFISLDVQRRARFLRRKRWDRKTRRLIYLD